MDTERFKTPKTDYLLYNRLRRQRVYQHGFPGLSTSSFHGSYSADWISDMSAGRNWRCGT